MIKRDYAIVSPCRNEVKFMRNTLDCAVAQTIQSALWLIVNDGSTDETVKILDEFAQKPNFTQVVNREERSLRSLGPGVINRDSRSNKLVYLSFSFQSHCSCTMVKLEYIGQQEKLAAVVDEESH